MEDPPLERKGEEVRLGEEGEVLLQLEEEEQLLPEVRRRRFLPCDRRDHNEQGYQGLRLGGHLGPSH